MLQGFGLGVGGNGFNGRDFFLFFIAYMYCVCYRAWGWVGIVLMEGTFSFFSLHTCIVCVTGLGVGGNGFNGRDFFLFFIAYMYCVCYRAWGWVGIVLMEGTFPFTCIVCFPGLGAGGGWERF